MFGGWFLSRDKLFDVMLQPSFVYVTTMAPVIYGNFYPYGRKELVYQPQNWAGSEELVVVISSKTNHYITISFLREKIRE